MLLAMSNEQQAKVRMCSLDGDSLEDIPVQANRNVPHTLGSVPTKGVICKLSQT